MPLYEYECPRGHVTERVVRLTDDTPKWVKCTVHCGRERSNTHYAGCERAHVCGERAKKREVYRVGVSGDLPTRGAF